MKQTIGTVREYTFHRKSYFIGVASSGENEFCFELDGSELAGKNRRGYEFSIGRTVYSSAG
jgi:hypothetical protein